MAVAFDAAVTTSDFGVTSLTTGSFTVGSGSNLAFVLGGFFFANVSTVTGSLGGTSATAVANTNLFSAQEVQLMAGVNPPSGSRTATMSWTTSASASLGCITVTGVDQATPMNNGATGSTAFGTTRDQAVTSASGDLTVTLCGDESGDTGMSVSAPEIQKTDDFAGMAIGDGNGTATHNWSRTGNQNIVSAGANFVQAAAGLTAAQQIGIFDQQLSGAMVGRVYQ